MATLTKTAPVSEQPGTSWRIPHHRIGAILQASEAEDGLDPLSLGVEGSAKVSNRILDRARFDQYTKELYGAVAERLNMELRLVPEAPTLSFGPGRIIDFPRFWLKSAEVGWMQCRVCMTICLHESQSKVWVRFLAHRDAFSEVQAPEVLNNFLAETEKLTGHILNGLVPLYRNDMRAATDVATADVGIKHIIQFIAVDTDARDLDDFADVVRFASARTALNAPGQSAREFKAMLRLIAPDIVQQGPPRLLQHTTSRGRTGVFAQFQNGPRIVHVGIGGLAEDEHKARQGQAFGVAHVDPTLDQSERLSGSLQVTAELANQIARDY